MDIDNEAWSAACQIIEEALEAVVYGDPRDPGIVTAQAIRVYLETVRPAEVPAEKAI